LAGKTARRAETLAHELFERVTDEIREAARMADVRRLSPATTAYGLTEILGT
jgi:hypothetical protein